MLQPRNIWHCGELAPLVSGHADNTGNGSAGFTLPVHSSSSGCGSGDAVASRSRAGTQEASGILGNEALNATGTGGRGQQGFYDVCANTTSRRDALHGPDNQQTGDTAHFCKAWDQSSVKMSKFVEHCRTRTVENHKCENCGKLLHLADRLDVHKRTHTDERPYKGQLCEKSFRYPNSVDIHIRAHTGEKPYTCERCGKSFRRSNYLAAHKRLHTGEKLHSCRTCGKSFVWMTRLHRHQLTHTDERPHVCRKCCQSFKAKGDLKRHLKLYCSEGAFVCETCDESFIDTSRLSHHRQRMHGDKTLSE
ncbi:uncharacterized protein [Dermacentor andersoni]|uniref:uncharacterized protein n=1 Tax=Dermacentor andersoni TaxID=34620 RepID=UPI003B3A512A